MAEILKTTVIALVFLYAAYSIVQQNDAATEARITAEARR